MPRKRETHHHRAWAIAVACAMTVVVACAPTIAPGTGGDRADPACRLLRGTATAPGTLTVVLPDPVRLDHAPDPENDSERILFRHLYETLLRVDCRGRVRAGLAESWRSDRGGGVWTFTLRRDARFWDGSAVTAGPVIAGWRALRSGPWGSGALAIAEAAVAVTDRVLTVTLSATHREPAVFAQPGLSVVDVPREDGWPHGAGAYRPGSPADPLGRSESIVAEPTTGGGPALRFTLTGTRDPRDPLDRGADVVVTRDRSTLEYAATRSRFVVVPLAWDRTYVLLAPGADERARGPDRSGGARRVSLELREDLARNAVGEQARPSEPPYFWERESSCDAGRAASAGHPRTSAPAEPGAAGLVVYPRDDPTARDLAERLVARAAARDGDDAHAWLAQRDTGLGAAGAPIVAAGWTPSAFAASLRSGDATAYIVRLARDPLDPCSRIAALRAAAPWLNGDGTDDDERLLPGPAPVAGPGLAARVVPLIDTRASLVVRRAHAPEIVIDGEGTPLLLGTGSRTRP